MTVCVKDNYSDGEVDSPRTDKIVFHESKLSSYAYVIVSQEGDCYRGISEISVKDIFSTDDHSFIIVKDAVVNIVSGKSMIISDKFSLEAMCATTITDVKAGDEIILYGQKLTDENSCVTIKTDQVDIISSGNFIKYPNSTDIYDLDNKIDEWSFIIVEGVVNGNTIELNDKSTF